MKKPMHTTRILALALCLMLTLALCAPAMAATTFYGTVSAATDVYASASTTSKKLTSIPAGQTISITSQSGEFYCIVTSGTVTSAYVPKANVTNVRTTPSTSGGIGSGLGSSGSASIGGSPSFGGGSGSTTPGFTIGSGSGTSGTVGGTGGTTAGTTSKNYGYITNCTSYVSFRSGASSSASKISDISKDTVVTILSTSGSYYQVDYNGTTGYVSKQYVAMGLPSGSSGSGSSGSSGSGSSGSGSSGSGSSGSDSGSSGSAVGGGSSSPSSHVAEKLAAAKKKNSDTVGYIYLPGTNVDQPILYGKDHYYANRNINKKSDSKGSVYSFYNVLTRNNVITGHNMRVSGTMFHELHHIQEKTLGNSKCQAAKSSDCALRKHAIPSSTPNLNNAADRIWQVNLFGYNQWEVWAMYEVKANEPKSTLAYNYQHLSNSSSDTIKKWIDYQKGRSEIKLSTSVSPDDVFLTVYTCGTNYDSSTAQSRLYFFLKAVK